MQPPKAFRAHWSSRRPPPLLLIVASLLLLSSRHNFLLLCAAQEEEEEAPPAEATTAAPTAAATNQAWGGCVDPTNPGAKLEIGKLTTVCLQVGSGTAWNAGISYVRLVFTPEADKYSRFHVPNSYNDLVYNSTGSIWSGNSITVGSASGKQLSYLRLYYDFTRARIYPYLTAVITVREGVVSGITWDDSCVFCARQDCDEITYDYNGHNVTNAQIGQFTTGCYLREEDCTRLYTTEQSTVCDLTLYVVWAGTDARGTAFQSSASRFSAFPRQNLQERLMSYVPDWRPSLPENPFKNPFGGGGGGDEGGGESGGGR